MLVTEFIKNFTEKKISNTKIEPEAVQKYLRKELNIKTYIPFEEKRKIADIMVDKYMTEENGIKKYDNISSYVGFVSAMIMAHTDLEFSEYPITDYDLLAESGLLSCIISEFQESYNECYTILKMAIDMELEDNHVGALIGKFLDIILKKMEGLMEGFDVTKLLGEDITVENLATISGFLDKLK